MPERDLVCRWGIRNHDDRQRDHRPKREAGALQGPVPQGEADRSEQGGRLQGHPSAGKVEARGSESCIAYLLFLRFQFRRKIYISNSESSYGKISRFHFSISVFRTSTGTALIQTQEVCGRQIEKERKEKEEAKKYISKVSISNRIDRKLGCFVFLRRRKIRS